MCFEDFTTHIQYGDRIAIIGRNGSGKSTFYSLRMLQHYTGTLIVVSHDVELLRQNVNIFWHIDQGKIKVFSGHYDDYCHEQTLQRAAIEKTLHQLKQEKKQMHHSLMQEQQRASKSQAKGIKSIKERKWPTIVSGAKMRRSQETFGKRQMAIYQKKQELIEQLSQLFLVETIVPTFSLAAAEISDRMLVAIHQGSIGYVGQKLLLTDIHFSLSSKQRIAITGDNGSGKSTFVKAILNDPHVHKTGEWLTPKPEEIGYLDQHYATLSPDRSVMETIADCAPHWSAAEIRQHLKDFLFRKNEEVQTLVQQLSGGEKARLSLAVIAANTPRLLILDEIANNIDLETRHHMITVLNHYPGALIIISHDEDFLKAIQVTENLDMGGLFSVFTT